jgi:replicative DNA helicase
LQIIPFNDSIEKAVIVAIMADPMLLPKISAILEPTDFYNFAHQEIFSVLRELDTIDSLSVEDSLSSEKTRSYFQTLVEDSEKLLPSISNVIYYAETIKGKAKLRAAINLGQNIIASCYEPNIDVEQTMQKLEDDFAKFLKQRIIEDRSDSSVEAFNDFLVKLDRRAGEEQGTTTGFREVDDILHHLDELVVLAAKPGMGKTAFAINVARHAINNAPVIMFSLEQTKEQIFERMLAAESQIGLEEIRTGAYKEEELSIASVDAAARKLRSLYERFHIDDRPRVNASYITSVARQKKFEWGNIGLIVVDYLHIMRLAEGNKVDTLGEACSDLRALAKELNCPVLLLSQLNRGSQEGRDAHRRPDLTDLRSSGEIEQNADTVMFLHRESYYEEAGIAPDEDRCEVIVRKNRNGRQGTVEVRWLPSIQKFSDY